MRQRFWLTFLVLVGACTPALASPTEASPTSTTVATSTTTTTGEHPPVTTEGEAARQFAELVADDLGITVEEARFLLDYQDGVSNLIGQIPEDILQNRWAGAAFDPDTPGTVTFYFKGEVPGEVVDLIFLSGLPGVQIVDGLKYTRDEIHERGFVVADAMFNGLGLRGSTSGGQFPQAVRVYVAKYPIYNTAELAELLAQIASDPLSERSVNVSPDDILVYVGGPEIYNMLVTPWDYPCACGRR